MKVAVILSLAIFATAGSARRPDTCVCEPTVTTVSGTQAPTGQICRGDLIFEDTFERFDLNTWQHELTLAGGGNWEFQWYANNRSNSFVEDGLLNISPTPTADIFGESFLWSGVLNIHNGAPADQCTNPGFFGCERAGNPVNYVNPIVSARLRTVDSFAFKYGFIEVRAQNPTGDWLWPAIWMMPKSNVYGQWPVSGEIDIMETRGNLNLTLNDVNIGVEQVGHTLHFGPTEALNSWPTTTFNVNTEPGQGFNNDFHNYQMEWNENGFIFSIDDEVTATVPMNNTSFWERGNFDERAPGTTNPWRTATNMAPFDEEFYIILNMAVGGVAFFPDAAENPGGKPWGNNSPRAASDFWDGKDQWLPTWGMDDPSMPSTFKIDYVRVWAL